MNRAAVLIKGEQLKADAVNWPAVGQIVNDLPELFQLVKEQDISVVLVDSTDFDIKPAIAMKLRRRYALLEIWKIVEHASDELKETSFIDGSLVRDLGQRGITAKVKQILETKELLARYKIVGRSAKIKTVAETVERIAPAEVSVLIVGPSGSGKELIAEAIHKDSKRNKGPFVAFNCGALAEGILESELFGHERGAFTGSVGKREGLFAKADGGTIFLDEIGETHPGMQVKLLRVLEDGTYYPVGSSNPKRVNVRIVAATNRDLTEAIKEKQFREDLYFRISAIKIIVPPLLDRKEDIQPLLQHFWQRQNLDYSDSALELLMNYDWPGNVRQLKNFTERMTALKPSGLIDTNDIERFLAEQHATATHLPVSTGKTTEEAGQELVYRAIMSLGNEVRLLRDLITANLPSNENGETGRGGRGNIGNAATVESMEEALIEKTLRDTGGNRKATAKRLGIGERTLYRKLKKFGLT
ncbi:MAG TPA: sigma-54 dependent transcriptional regulator [candidate division Zixibacteria bacterium]|nr:sigma-54 dependent transcriptional regulator [candidate division Zixibacteria bacterium]